VLDRLSRPHASRAVCQAGRVDIVFPPHCLHLGAGRPSGRTTVSGRASTLTSAACLQGLAGGGDRAHAGLRHFSQLRLAPIFIAAAGALRHDALEAQLAGVREHDRADSLNWMLSTSATRCERAFRRSSRGRWRRSSSSRLRRSKATNEARAPPALVRRAAKTECPPGGTPPPRRRSWRFRRAGRPPPPRCAKTCR
jgi:hypothetical protein